MFNSSKIFGIQNLNIETLNIWTIFGHIATPHIPGMYNIGTYLGNINMSSPCVKGTEYVTTFTNILEFSKLF